jgi:hypothetical protein
VANALNGMLLCTWRSLQHVVKEGEKRSV